MSRGRVALAALAGLCLGPVFIGCAARQPSSPFIIRSGHGPLNAGKSLPPARADHRRMELAQREALAHLASVHPESLPSIERLDKGLREALAVLGRQETAAAHVAVGDNYRRVGVFDAAYDHYSDALEIDSKNVAAWDGRARVWRQWGITESALYDVHRAIFYGPKNASPQNTLGTILEAAGQCSEAHEAYASALKLDPSADWAKSNLDRLTCDRADPGDLRDPGNPRRPGS